MPKFNCILLVDDDYINNFLTERLLRKSNIAREVKAVRNGEEALTYLSEEKNKFPDLILLDMKMPEMGGIEFLKNFKKMIVDKKSKVILLTGSVHPEEAKTLEMLGYHDLIQKPFSEEKLYQILSRELVRKH
ncbi:MAG TPA: response regulator [Cytophagaceae bacterium]|jgi:CheY-like chemotaxis protein|nr:response regulator [Cytophagaceae bacterium]